MTRNSANAHNKMLNFQTNLAKPSPASSDGWILNCELSCKIRWILSPYLDIVFAHILFFFLLYRKFHATCSCCLCLVILSYHDFKYDKKEFAMSTNSHVHFKEFSAWLMFGRWQVKKKSWFLQWNWLALIRNQKRMNWQFRLDCLALLTSIQEGSGRFIICATVCSSKSEVVAKLLITSHRLRSKAKFQIINQFIGWNSCLATTNFFNSIDLLPLCKCLVVSKSRTDWFFKIFKSKVTIRKPQILIKSPFVKAYRAYFE